MRSRPAKRPFHDELSRWRSLVAAIPGVICVRRPFGDFSATFVGENVMGQLGYEPGEFLQTSNFWMSKLHPEDRERIVAGLSALVDHRRHSLEYRFLHKNGTYVWIHDEHALQRNQNGEAVEIVGCMLDISARKAAEDALYESQERYLRLVDLIPDAVWINREGRIDFINGAGLRLLGATDPVEVLGRSPFDIVHPDYRLAERERTARMLAGGNAAPPVDEKIVRLDGEERDVQVAASPFPDRNGLSILVALRDVTERKRAERDLGRGEERYRGLVEMHPDPLLIYQDSRIAYANRAAMKLFGASTQEQITGKDLMQLVQPDSRPAFSERMTILAEPGAVIPPSEDRLVSLDGTVLDVEVTAGSFRQDGSTAVQVVLRDITERKREQQQLQESNARLRELASALEEVREEERGRLARELHDELAQLLTALRMDASWIRRNASREALHLVERADAMTELIDRVASSVRRIARELRPKILDDLGLAAAIRSIAQETSARSTIECQVTSKIEGLAVPDLLATPLYRMVQEALTNVLRHSDARTVTITLWQEVDALAISIHDDGKGLSDNDLRKRGSFGLLGMRERAAAIGGKLRIFSNSGEGTTIEIRAPLSPPAPEDRPDRIT